MKPNETVDYHIKSTWHALTRMHNRIAGGYGLTQASAYVLMNIAREGTPATKIAPLIGMEPTSLSRLLKSLERKGLLYRVGDLEDKRVIRIFLTEEGLIKKKIALEVIQRFNERVQRMVNKADATVFFSVIQTINAATSDFEPVII